VPPDPGESVGDDAGAEEVGDPGADGVLAPADVAAAEDADAAGAELGVDVAEEHPATRATSAAKASGALTALTPAGVRRIVISTFLPKRL
jgi:hypothetical protein